MPTRTVTGTCRHVDGTGWASGVVKFHLITAFETTTEVYPQEVFSETLDANGAFSITLGVPDTGSASYVIITPDNAAYSVSLADGAATTLQALLSL